MQWYRQWSFNLCFHDILRIICNIGFKCDSINFHKQKALLFGMMWQTMESSISSLLWFRSSSVKNSYSERTLAPYFSFIQCRILRIFYGSKTTLFHVRTSKVLSKFSALMFFSRNKLLSYSCVLLNKSLLHFEPLKDFITTSLEYTQWKFRNLENTQYFRISLDLSGILNFSEKVEVSEIHLDFCLGWCSR